MAVIADKCPEISVKVVDNNAARIDAWNSRFLPVYEPGLDEIINKTRGKNLSFSTDISSAIAGADCVFISVNTPTKSTGLGAGKASDLRFLESCARQIAATATGHTLVVEKSTLPVKSAETVKAVLSSLGNGKTFEILSNPEFLAEGSAIQDLLSPDRVLIGGDSTRACDLLGDVYRRWVPESRIILTNLWSSELAKLASNAFLAQRVSSINALSALCELTEANITEVAKAVGFDSRIGKKFLSAGPGFGGSCFKKDILNLVYLCEYYGLPEVADYWAQVVKINEWQQNRLVRQVVKKMFNTLSGKTIAILGFAFKKNTNDTRETPAIPICKSILNEGANLNIFDPKVPSDQIYRDLETEDRNTSAKINVISDLRDVFKGADAAIIVTDWDVFSGMNWDYISTVMRQPAWIFDTRNCISGEKVVSTGLKYWSTGNGSAS